MIYGDFQTNDLIRHVDRRRYNHQEAVYVMSLMLLYDMTVINRSKEESTRRRHGFSGHVSQTDPDVDVFVFNHHLAWCLTYLLYSLLLTIHVQRQTYWR